MAEETKDVYKGKVYVRSKGIIANFKSQKDCQVEIKLDFELTLSLGPMSGSNREGVDRIRKCHSHSVTDLKHSLVTG